MRTRGSANAFKRRLRSANTTCKSKKKCRKFGNAGRNAKRYNTSNLRPFKIRTVGTQTDVAHLEPTSMRHQTTQTTLGLTPRSGKYTTQDSNKDKCLAGQSRLSKCMRSGFHWTPKMIAVMLRFLYYLVVSLNWTWTQAIEKTSTIFQMKINNVFKLAKCHRDSSSNDWPKDLQQRKRGRGSDTFLANDAIEQKYTKLKREVLVDILEFVRDRNRHQKGMCTIRAVQAHLFAKHRTMFKTKTVWYAMRKRLGLHYKTVRKNRIVFTQERLSTADTFVSKLDAALKLQDAGTHVLVYMDETYVHTNHMPSKCWQEDGDDDDHRVERSRSKGALTIIIHALTRDGWLCCFEGDGVDGALLDGNPERDRPRPAEFDSPSPCHNCEMIFRSKIAKDDYHDNMDGAMFEKWIVERLQPTFEKRYPGKAMALVLDNAPYHHVHPQDSFFASGKSKSEIVEKLEELGVHELSMQPFISEDQWGAPPAADDPDLPLSKYEEWVFYEAGSGVVYLIDGVSNQGYGDVMVYTKVTQHKLTTVESTLLDDWRRLTQTDFRMIGRGPGALRAVRSMMRNNRIPRDLCRDVTALREQCQQHARIARARTFTYCTSDMSLKYNGAGEKGTGGPKGTWLRAATDKYIIEHHPELRETKIMRIFDNLGWLLVFTVPYWAKSQPAELAWAFVKNYVAWEWYPGRTTKDVRHHVHRGMYGGPKKDGGVHRGVDARLAQKFILHTHKYINEYISDMSPTHRGRGTIGNL